MIKILRKQEGVPKLQTPKTYCSYPETYQKNEHFAYNPSPKSEYYLQMS